MSRGDGNDAMKRIVESTGTDRNLELYKSKLGFTDEDLRRWAKLGWIVDLGSGWDQLFAQQAQCLLGEGAQVLSVDPSLAASADIEPRGVFSRQILGKKGTWQAQPNTIAALIQEGFLAENSVAVILALWSVPHYLDPKKPKELEEALNNIVLALMPGGEFRAYPIAPSQRDDIEEILSYFPNVTVEFPEEASGELLIVRKHKSSD